MDSYDSESRRIFQWRSSWEYALLRYSEPRPLLNAGRYQALAKKT